MSAGLKKWVNIHEIIRPDHRENIVLTALKHLPHASRSLKTFACDILNRAVQISGFRDVEHTRPQIAQRYVIEKMLHQNDVATAIICLWGEANKNLIYTLRTNMESAGISIKADWTWEQVRSGFDSDVAEAMASKIDFSVISDPGLRHDDLMMAAYWLSGGIKASLDDLEEAPRSQRDDWEHAGGKMDANPNQGLTTLSLEELQHRLHTGIDDLGAVQAEFIEYSHTLLASAREGKLSTVESTLLTLQESLPTWQASLESLQNTFKSMLARLRMELDTRPDLQPGLDYSVDTPAETWSSDFDELNFALREIEDIIERLNEYDAAKDSALNQLESEQAVIANLKLEIADWERTEPAEPEALLTLEREELADAELANIREVAAEAVSLRENLEQSLKQLRDTSRRRIGTLVEGLLEIGTEATKKVSDDFALAELEPETMEQLSDPQLRQIEMVLDELMKKQAVTSETSKSAQLAIDLLKDWTEEAFETLLKQLACENRHVEACLLLLSANIEHPRSEDLILEDDVVESILQGLQQLSPKPAPFQMLTLSAPNLFHGWQAGDQNSEIKVGFALLAAYYAGDYALPKGFLWQISNTWPVDEMENWNKIWQAALRDKLIAILSGDEEDHLAEDLEKTETKINKLLENKQGHFVHLNSLQSRRHQRMLSETLMTEFSSMRNQLQKIDDELSTAPDHVKLTKLAYLKEFFKNQVEDKLRKTQVEDRYESAIFNHGVQDSVFHRKTALRAVHQTAEALKDYGDQLVAFWEGRIRQESSVELTNLQAELDLGADDPRSKAWGRLALEQLAQPHNKRQMEWKGTKAQDLSERQLMVGLLNDAAFALKLPRTVSFLTNEDISWADFLENMLEDVSNPVDAEEAADLLLYNEAPSQALLLADRLSLELQRQAQELLAEKQRAVASLQEELLKTNGEVKDLIDDRDLGRWNLVYRKLSKRLNEQREIRAIRRRELKEKALEIRREINDLDAEIFDVKDIISQEVFKSIQNGLALARQATNQLRNFAEIRSYIQELHYRLDHSSWPLDELQSATDRLEQLVNPIDVAKSSDLTLEQVVDLLNGGKLQRLGIEPNGLVSSQIETRYQLLTNWLSVREASGFLTESLTLHEQQAIQAVFRYFRQMVSMSRVRSQSTGKHIAYDDPIIASHWQLMYPKTTVLEEYCVFVCLPGNPPRAKKLDEFEHVLEDKKWLSSGWFVFLFVPGSTPEINKRLLRLNRDRGLVIVDGPTMLSMVLAESDHRKPLGRLRSLMLNARGAEADIFRINQLVEARTGIFVGRERIVKRIVTSGDNYAVYGGRRIGKSSVLAEVSRLLKQRQNVEVIFHSFEGDEECSDDAAAYNVANEISLGLNIATVGDFKPVFQAFIDEHPDRNLVVLLDEIDRYIEENSERHVLIEALRALSERYGNRFRVVIAGFMELYQCLQGNGPYTPTSDPWGRMLNDMGPLGNLRPASAERIAREGFLNILGWEFENPALPQRIVERTGGHPAFVQQFCKSLKNIVATRGDRCVRLQDVKEVFEDSHSDECFIKYVSSTLEMNLDSVGHYIILWVADTSSSSRSFTWGQIQEIASLLGIPEKWLNRSLERLKVTSVVEKQSAGVYEFCVPDYPLILEKLGDNEYIDVLAEKIRQSLGQWGQE